MEPGSSIIAGSVSWRDGTNQDGEYQKMDLRIATYLSISLLATTAWSQARSPVGNQFQVNTYTTSYQGESRVASGGDGGFVVVWRSAGSSGTDTSGLSIQGQRFDATGAPSGGEFQANTYTTSGQYRPSVAVGSDGDFVVVWDSQGSSGTDNSSYSVQGQRFNAAGTPSGGQFQVNTSTYSFQASPSVAVAADGDFVVVWFSMDSNGTDTSDRSIQGQRFNTAGAKVGGEFQVNTYTTEDQKFPSVATDTSGAFVVVWQSDGSSGTDSSGASIQGQRFNAAGAKLGGEFQVNTYTTGFQYNPSVGVDGDGDFVVVWGSGAGSSGTDDSYSIQGQRFNAAGTKLGGEFQVNTYTTGTQVHPSVDVDPTGSFVVVWTSYRSDGADRSNTSVQGQRFSAAGMPIGDQFEVNSYTTSYQNAPSIASSALGEFIVVWNSQGSSGTDSDQWSVQGQRFSWQIFADGFESGNTSAWSLTNP